VKAVFVLFDSLNRRVLPPYGCDWVHAPNFTRLAERTVTFDNCYAGSMPCVPARRELHTGRYNFLHRSWGPLEPFDDSVPEMLTAAGVHTHLVTDHQHYWEDGGATYHTRFGTHEFFRGQEGDAWKGQVADPPVPASHRLVRHGLWRQDWVNRQHLGDPADHPQTLTFDAGLDFLRTNVDEDGWFVQIECFDPHEPFFSYADHRRHYPPSDEDVHFDWPDYKKVDEEPSLVRHARSGYAALLTMCDASLGRVLDFFDDHGLWEDTLLIVGTDHGLLLGEHGWWGKNVQPWYDENIHTPLFVWDPRAGRAGERRDALVQTIDIGPTLLDFFGVPPTPRMQGRSLASVVAEGRPVREAALFGSFGGHVNVTDGRYVYMRACATPANAPLFEHTLMPTHMNSRFDPAELRDAELTGPFDFTREVPVLRVPGHAWGNPHAFGTLLFDLATDPEQQHPLTDESLELRMVTLLLDLMRETDSPPSQYERLGLPADGPADASHLLTRRQFATARAAMLPAPRAGDFRSGWPSVNSPLRQLMDDPGTRPVLEAHLGALPDKLVRNFGGLSPVQLATMNPALGHELLRRLDHDLT
jgi:arylsulfatase A-like enzyme